MDDSINVLMEIYKTKLNEKINFENHCVKNLQIFLAAMGVVLTAAYISDVFPSDEFPVLALLPFLIICMYLIHIYFLWIMFGIDEDCLRIINSLDSKLNANFFGSAEDPGPLRQLHMYATSEYYEMVKKSKFTENIERFVIAGIFFLCCSVSVTCYFNFL